MQLSKRIRNTKNKTAPWQEDKSSRLLCALFNFFNAALAQSNHIGSP